MTHRTHIRRGIAALLLIAAPSVASAATYHVAKSAQGGNNGNSCTAAQNVNTPKLTIAAGIACLANGGNDTLFVRAGTYDENISSVPSGASAGSRNRIANYNGEVVWIKPTTPFFSGVIFLETATYLEFDGINVDNTNVANIPGSCYAIWFSSNNGTDPHHIRFKNAEVNSGFCGGASIGLGSHNPASATTGAFELQNLVIHGGGATGGCGFQCTSYAVYVMTKDSIIEGLDVYNTSGAAIQIYNTGGDSPDNNIIRNSRFHDITRSGYTSGQGTALLLDGGIGNQVYNNVIYGIDLPGNQTTHVGIVVVGGSNYLIANNTIANNVDVGGIRVEAGASNTIVRNNIVVNNGTPMWEDFGQNTSKSNNLGSTPATGWITGDPSFVNAAARDYHLQADSDAIDAGATVAQVASDFDGLARPQNSIYDIGAYEYPATPAVLAPTVTILTPTSAETFTTTQAELSEPADRVTGSAVDDISVASCSWVNTATGHSGATVGTTAWSIPILPLATGVNPVTVTCLDGAGNMGSDTLTITSTGTPVQSYRLRIRSAQ